MGWVWKWYIVGFDEKLTSEELSDRGHYSCRKSNFLCSTVPSLSLNVFLQMLQNTAVDLSIDGLALGDKISMHNATDLEMSL